MGQQTAFVIHPDNKHAPLPRPPALCLEEACGLVEAIGVDVVFADITALNRPRAGTFIGKGYADQLKERAEGQDRSVDGAQCIYCREAHWRKRQNPSNARAWRSCAYPQRCWHQA